VDPTTCNVKLQESKLRQGKPISWRGTGYGWRRSPNKAKNEKNEAKTEAQAATVETLAIVKIEIRIDQGRETPATILERRGSRSTSHRLTPNLFLGQLVAHPPFTSEVRKESLLEPFKIRKTETRARRIADRKIAITQIQARNLPTSVTIVKIQTLPPSVIIMRIFNQV
jgi:hypothetical protein